jgi:predicted transcriptional regulator
MSAKQELRHYIDELSDDEALSLWQRIQCEASEPIPPLTDADRASIERGLAQLKAGRGIPHAEVLRKLGIAE